MAITLETVVRNAACDAEVDLVDADADPGYIEIRDSTTVLVTILFEATAFGAAGAVNPGEAVAASFPKNANAVTDGVADNYRVYDGADTLLWSGVVGQGTGDLSLNNTNIANGQNVSITSFTHTVPATE